MSLHWSAVVGIAGTQGDFIITILDSVFLDVSKFDQKKETQE